MEKSTHVLLFCSGSYLSSISEEEITLNQPQILSEAFLVSLLGLVVKAFLSTVLTEETTPISAETTGGVLTWDPETGEMFWEHLASLFKAVSSKTES